MIRIPLLALMPVTVAVAQSFNDFDLAPHNYFDAVLEDPMTALVQRLESGDVDLEKIPNGKPLVERLLEELSIPVSSQVLVFTKTSLQRRVVNPRNPRAIYFNEDVYLGWMPDGRIEIASMDPALGGIFYFQRPLKESTGPRFEREESCLGCHAGSATNFLPGLLARSVYSNAEGRALKSMATFERVGHQVPFDERWGGWYVTGYHGAARHLGNALATSDHRSALSVDKEKGANRESLADFFSADLHLRPDSDILALLLLDHQISMHHWIMEAHYRVRQAFFEAGIVGRSREDLGRIDGSAREELEKCLQRLMRYLVFADEAPLGEEKWKGAVEYRDTFLAAGKKDVDGRSLRDLRLQDHIFAHRCSYMIYSKSFAALPVPLKEEVYHRLRQILSTDSEVDGFHHLGGDEKTAIAEILIATLPDLAAYWSSIEG